MGNIISRITGSESQGSKKDKKDKKDGKKKDKGKELATGWDCDYEIEERSARRKRARRAGSGRARRARPSPEQGEPGPSRRARTPQRRNESAEELVPWDSLWDGGKTRPTRRR